MTEQRCHWSREDGDYLTEDGDTCDTPRGQHCTARRSCAIHLGWGELTCARCVGRVRMDIRQVVTLAALMLPEAMEQGNVNTRAATLAGPAGDPLVLSWRRLNASPAFSATTIGDGTEATDPTEVLGIWQAMLSESYGHELPDRITLTTAAAYLERNLNQAAQDEDQDFRLMAREIRDCRANLESVLGNSRTPERGVPCPTCVAEEAADPVKVKLVREYPHWCEDPKCERIHVATDELDVWVCPRNRDHWWSHADYTNRLLERKGAERAKRVAENA